MQLKLPTDALKYINHFLNLFNNYEQMNMTK